MNKARRRKRMENRLKVTHSSPKHLVTIVSAHYKTYVDTLLK